MHGFLGTPDGAVCGFAPNTPGGMPPWRTPDPGTSIDGLWLASAYAGMGGFNGATRGRSRSLPRRTDRVAPLNSTMPR